MKLEQNESRSKDQDAESTEPWEARCRKTQRLWSEAWKGLGGHAVHLASPIWGHQVASHRRREHWPHRHGHPKSTVVVLRT